VGGAQVLGLDDADARRRVERMAEPHVVTIDVHELGVGCPGQVVRNRAAERNRQRVQRRLLSRGGHDQQLSGRSRKGRQPAQHELGQVEARDERIIGRTTQLRIERPGELQRVQRVAARVLVDLSHLRMAEVDARPLGHQAVERTGAQAGEVNVVRGVRRPSERLRRSPRDPGGAQHPHPAARAPPGEPTYGEGQRSCRRRVNPLQVVDRHEDRSMVGEGGQRRRQRQADRAVLDRGTIGLLEHERHLESATLRSRQGQRLLVEVLGQQVTEDREGQVLLGVRRRRPQHLYAVLTRRLDPGRPEHALADPRLAQEHQHGIGHRLVRPDVSGDEPAVVVATDDGSESFHWRRI
jgi:hypothetical protein